MSGDKSSIVWIASYPRTGSNLVRRIFRGLLAPQLAPSVAIPSVRKKMPETAQSYELFGKSVRFYKTHSLPKGVEHLGPPAAVILVERHPLDVILSYLNYAYHKGRSDAFIDQTLKPVEEIIADGEIDHYLDEFLTNGCIPEYRGMSGSFRHFSSNWREFAAGQPKIRFRYETMAGNVVPTIRRAARFLGIENCDAQSIAARISEQTQIDGHFHWKKTAYNFESMLPAQTVAKFEREAADLLAHLCYKSRSQASATTEVVSRRKPRSAGEQN